MNKLVLAICTISMISFSNLTASPIRTQSANSDSVFITTELLGRPTDTSVTINALANSDLELFFEYGVEPSLYVGHTVTKLFSANEPIEEIISGLKPNTHYYYRMRYRKLDTFEFETGEEHMFHTQRPKNSTFTFVVQADPHLDEQSNPEIYKQTMLNTLADDPDFLIDLGDNFMSDKIPEIYPGKTITYNEIVNRLMLLRDYYDLVCHSVPLFLVIGNHEGELGWQLNGTSENFAMWATSARKLYYPNPAPDHFYTGSNEEEPFVGQRENYYAFEWGDALVVVLDPYWYTTIKPRNPDDNWNWTLGEKQYHWFRQTLENSDAKFKFVFCHHLLGGNDSEGRGGSEYAPYYEQGGLNEDGSWGFDEKRPGWGKPIHQLMVENNVTIFFHGHDHFFAKQDANGVVYQLVPQPSHPNYKRASLAEKYGYIIGDILPNSGHLRVTVLESNVKVDYVRAYLPADEDASKGRNNGQVDFSYTISAAGTSVDLCKTEEALPENYSLKQNYPNPFNLTTTITFSLSAETNVKLKIFNVLGKQTAALVGGNLSAGLHTYQWQATDVPSGLYYCTLETESERKAIEMLLLK